MKQAVGGGYLLASNYTDSTGEKGILITRFDELLNIIWEKTINELGSIENSISFIQDSTGNIYIAGYAQDLNNQFGLIIKTDSIINIIWKKKIQFQTYMIANRILIYSSALYIIGQAEFNGGSFFTDSLFLMKIDTSGLIQWTNTYPANNGFNFGVDILLNNSNDLLIGNWDTRMQNFGGLSGYNLAGSKLWDNRWNLDGNSGNPQGDIAGMSSANNGDVVLFGTKGSNTTFDIRNFVMLCNSTGNQLLWKEYAIEYQSSYFPLNGLQGCKTSDGGFAFTGYIGLSFFTAFKPVLVKLDSNMNFQWCRMFGIINSVNNTDLTFVQLRDSGFCLIGTNQNKIFILKTDSSGFSGCNDSTLNVVEQLTSSFQISYSGEQSVITSPVNYSPVSLTIFSNNNIDTLCSLYTRNHVENFIYYFTISLNPSKNQFTIENKQNPLKEIEIFNLLGENIYSASANSELYTVNCELWPEGIYFVVASDAKGNKMTEMISVIR